MAGIKVIHPLGSCFYSDLAGGETGIFMGSAQLQTFQARGMDQMLHSSNALGLIFIFPPSLLQCTQEEVSSEDEDEEMPEVGLQLKTALAGVGHQGGPFDIHSSSFKLGEETVSIE